MMQELLNVVQHNYNSNTNSSSSINSSNSLSSPSSTSDHQPQQNLRCPRCDSSNTKFCYYNNYNLTQPRHFCKTCRRYWTKGGALRNVPIGGGCRKSRTIVTSNGPTTNKTGPQKPKPTMSASDIMGLQCPGSSLQLPPGLAPYSSHLLALLKASTQHMQQTPNSQNLLNSYRIKEEMINANNQQQQQMQHNLWNSNVDFNSNGSYYFPSFSSATTTAMSMSTAGVMEAVPLQDRDIGFWNNGAAMSWNDISASNGAFL